MLFAVSKSLSASQPLAFKISRADDVGKPGLSKTASDSRGAQRGPLHEMSQHQWLLETLLIAACFFLYAGQPAPDVNESHYLTKAKPFWDASYCPNDLFLGSSFSHWLFYVCFGWMTKFMSLSAFAWTGRILTWSLTAFAWQRLSSAIVPLKFMSILSALFFILLNDRFHLAGEWVVGGFEAKGIAYFFVIWALSFLVRGQWKYVWPLLGAASAFHVLVGGWAVIACLFASIVVQIRRASTGSTRLEFWQSQASQWWKPLLIGGAISLLGVLPPLISDFGATSEAKQFASEVYVGQRIAHHLHFSAFPTWNVARFAMMAVFWGFLYMWLKNRLLLNPVIFHRKLEPLQDFATGALLISFGGLMLSGLAETGNEFATGMLKFYCFRLADFAIPATIALASCFVVAYWLELENDIFRRSSSVIFTVCVFLAAGLLFVERHHSQIPNADLRSLPQYPESEQRFRESWVNWKKLCAWVNENTPQDAAFVTPYQQQTFKWYASRTEIVNWKDIPQDAHSIANWYRRLQIIQEPQQASDLGLLVYTDDRLAELAAEYEADYLVVPQSAYDLACNDPNSGKPGFECVYPKADERVTWVVLKLR
jgi:hypothetical protein